MHRTQIYLSDQEIEVLDRAAADSGASRSELIRRAIRREFGFTRGNARLDALRASAGIWRDAVDPRAVTDRETADGTAPQRGGGSAPQRGGGTAQERAGGIPSDSGLLRTQAVREGFDDRFAQFDR